MFSEAFAAVNLGCSTSSKLAVKKMFVMIVVIPVYDVIINHTMTYRSSEMLALSQDHVRIFHPAYSFMLCVTTLSTNPRVDFQ